MDAQPQPRRQRPHQRLRPRQIQRHPPAQKMIRPQPPQQQISIRNRQLIPRPVAGRPRIGPRRLRPHRQRAPGVHPRDRPPARPDRVNFNHRHAYRMPPHRGAAGFLDPPRAKRHIGGSAAHIQGNNIGVARLRRGMKRPHHAPGRAAEDRPHRLLRGQPRRNAAPRRLHHPQPRAQRPLQFPQIAAHYLPHISVDHHGAGPLILPELRQYPRRKGYKRRRTQLPQRLINHIFVNRI